MEESWNEVGIEGWGCYVVKEKLKRLREKLKIWNRDHFGNLDARVDKLREELLSLDLWDERWGLGEGDVIRRKEVKKAQLLLQLKHRKSLLVQKAKLNWIKDGDVNIRVFPWAINMRRLRNGILGLDVRGEWMEEPRWVKEKVGAFFRDLFSTRGQLRIEMSHSLADKRLGEGDMEELVREFTEDEIKDAVWECVGAKSLGPDRFNLEFFKSCWDIVKGDLLRMMKEFHANGKLARGCNTSFIAFIPKKGGRLTVIKSVLSAIPLYNLSFLRLPKSVEKCLTFLFCRFLWEGSEGERKLAWVS